MFKSARRSRKVLELASGSSDSSISTPEKQRKVKEGWRRLPSPSLGIGNDQRARKRYARYVNDQILSGDL